MIFSRILCIYLLQRAGPERGPRRARRRRWGAPVGPEPGACLRRPRVSGNGTERGETGSGEAAEVRAEKVGPVPAGAAWGCPEQSQSSCDALAWGGTETTPKYKKEDICQH